MSSIYLGEVLRIEDPVTRKPAMSVSWLTEIMGVDRSNFASYWREDRLTKGMKNTVEDNLSHVHDEVPLHSYDARLFFMLRSLRDLEDRARARIKSASMSRSAVVHSYEIGIRELFAIPMISKVLPSIKGGNRRALSQEDLTDNYLAGALLHTALIVWEEAADALTVRGQRATLDFEVVGLDGFVSVVDVAEQSLAFYGSAEFELRRLARRYRRLDPSALKEAKNMADFVEPDGVVLELREKEDRKARLAQQDTEIAAMQIASIASHAMDWQHATAAYKSIIGLTKGLQERLQRLAGSASDALRTSSALLDRLPDNQFIARNIAYQSIQRDDVEIMRLAAEVIARQTDTKVGDVWRTEIMGRKPLHQEIHIAPRFEDGIPKLLKPQGETK
ncbi:hypothetical protein ABID65_001126 [Bradyrhizobium sp. S3.9.2]|uniref:hypothetical protein n=1 Tax=Bradyrhizobium sp. S3.9.2 TaxID=3156432 RepID=UPI00339A0EE9